MNKKKLHEEVVLVRQTLINAMPTGVSVVAIIIALAELIKIYQLQTLDEDDD